MPSSQNIDLGVIIFGHKIASTRAPGNKGIVNTYFLHDLTQRNVIGKSDEEVMEAARREVVGLVPEVAQIDGYYVQRWEHSSPIHELGACAKIDAFVKSLDPTAPVQVMGDYTACPSMNVAVTTANRMAASIVANQLR